jgi:hypothetical protein
MLLCACALRFRCFQLTHRCADHHAFRRYYTKMNCNSNLVACALLLAVVLTGNPAGYAHSAGNQQQTGADTV